MKRTLARIIGGTIQALALGLLLFIAIVNLISLSTGAAVFRYQGF